MSIAKNAITSTVTFVDDAGQATDPDGDVVWTAYSVWGHVLATGRQKKTEATATGTFAWSFIPVSTGTHYTEAVATVGGLQQCARTAHEVTWI